VAAARRPQRACGARPASPAGLPARAPQTHTRAELAEQLAVVEQRADLVLALRLAQQTLAERAGVVICQSQLACEGLVHPTPQLLDEIQCELRAIKAERAALARLPC
jgi:cobalamin biosynthesis protein CbiD